MIDDETIDILDKTYHTQNYMKNMTIDELISKLVSIKENPPGDEEVCHIYADQLLIEFINELRVYEAFHNIKKWYS